MSQSNISNRKDILLLLLYSPGKLNEVNEPISGRTRLVKMLFLFREEFFSSFKKNILIDESHFYEFTAWNYGPFSKQVYDDLNFLILREFVNVNAKNGQDGIPEAADEYGYWLNSSKDSFDSDDYVEYVEEDFSLTKKGIEFTSSLFNGLSKSQKETLRAFKTQFTNASLRAILKYVYSKYPQTTTNSIIKNKIIN